MRLVLRDAEAGDAAAWRQLWVAYLAFYKDELAPEITAATWARILDPGHPMTCRIALDGDRALGFAIHHAHCSSWVLGEDVYLEDLFVVPEVRGQGVGRALIEDLMALGRAAAL